MSHPGLGIGYLGAMPLPDPGSRSDEQAGFLPLFLQHQASLFAFILANGIHPADADDVLQNVATVLWQRFADFEPGTDFRAWAYAVTRLEIRKQGDRWRRQQRVVQLDESSLDALVAGELPSPPEPRLERLQDCLARLGEGARTLLRLHYAEGLPQAAVGERLGLSHEAVRTRLSRLRRQLAACIARPLQPGTGAGEGDRHG